jgi:hypothetical protein
MATIDMSVGTVGAVGAAPYSAVPRLVELEVDFAAAATAKGSALAANDVIQTIDVPAGSLVYSVGMEVLEAMTGTSTDLALDVGVTGGDVDVFIDGFDMDGADVGDHAALASSGARPVLVTADDTIDILIAAQTGTFLTGKVRMYAVIMDVNGRDAPGVATAGS